MSGEREPGATPTSGGTFDEGWLALREPVDHRSRAEELLAPLLAAWRTRRWRRVVDLGAGAGSNIRYLAPRLPAPQDWTLVDHDASLLRRVASPAPDVTVTTRVGDLSDVGLEGVADAHLVAGAALLDLVSERWLRKLVAACAEGGQGVLFSTVYDGTVAWRRLKGPEDDPETLTRDQQVRELVNAHQRRNKGLGGALGPEAASVTHALFKEAGFDTWLVPSPWVLDDRDADLAGLLVEGWVQATREQDPAVAPWIESWGQGRTAQLRSGAVQVTVGHLDLLALRPED